LRRGRKSDLLSKEASPVVKRFFSISVILPLLAGCTSVAWSPYAKTAIQQDAGLRAEAALAVAYPNLISRRGSVLAVRGQTFTDRGDCQTGDCDRYRADGVWKAQYVGVDVSYYEEGDYFLVDSHDHIPIGSRPISSPSGRRFFTGHHDDRRWSPYQGASVWEWEPAPRRLRIVDTDLVAFESFVGWRGDSCVEFIGARGYNVEYRPARTFWLAEQDGDWRLSEEQPAMCAP
jgi:hypothetical protein